MTASDIDKLLAEKYSDGHTWFYFNQVLDMCHPHSGRIDGIAINVLPSKFQIVALEVKVSRNDFLNEIRNPGKREVFVALSSQFYYVVPHGLVEPSEVPEECGLMYVQKSRIVRKKIAQQRKIEAIDPMFFASLIRQAGRKFEHPLLRFVGREIDVDSLESEIESRVKKVTTSQGFINEYREKAEKSLLLQWRDSIRVADFFKRNRHDLGMPGWGMPTDKELEAWMNDLNERAAGKFGRSINSLRRNIKSAYEIVQELP